MSQAVSGQTFDRHKNYPGYEAEILADSISPEGHRLTSFDIVFPRMVLAEFNTHKVFSRNSASSRAIPVEKQLTKIRDMSFSPVFWGKLQPGMQAAESISPESIAKAEDSWRWNRNAAVLGAVALIGGVEVLKDEQLKEDIIELSKNFDTPPSSLSEPVHKQIANRLLEPFMWHEVIVTATDWDNYYSLRANSEAQPEIQVIAQMMIDSYQNSLPEQVDYGEWHVPLLREDEKQLPIEQRVKISVGRCARVSYLTHSGIRDIEKDIELHNDLISNGHMSPTEHVATPFTEKDWALIDGLKQIIESSPVEDYQKNNLHRQIERSGNFKGWHQYRKTLPFEDNFGSRPSFQSD